MIFGRNYSSMEFQCLNVMAYKCAFSRKCTAPGCKLFNVRRNGREGDIRKWKFRNITSWNVYICDTEGTEMFPFYLKKLFNHNLHIKIELLWNVVCIVQELKKKLKGIVSWSSLVGEYNDQYLHWAFTNPLMRYSLGRDITEFQREYFFLIWRPRI